jgi:subtilisin-like proprotein convertase family protein
VADGPGALSDFTGEDAAGTWTLSVSDNAVGDIGTLNSWGLDVDCLDVVSGTVDLPIVVPDNYSDGIVDTLEVVGTGCTLVSLSADIDLTHTYIGDLIVELTSPAGITVRLHDQEGGNADDIIGNYPLTLTESGPGQMSNFTGAGLDGDWHLSVSDNASSDVGTLNSWSLNASCE